MKPLKETRLGKWLHRLLGGKDGKLTASEVVVFAVDVLTRIADNPKVSAYTEATKSKLDNAVLRWLKEELPRLARKAGLHTQRGDDWQAFIEGTATALRAIDPTSRKRILPELAARGYQAELIHRGETQPLTLEAASKWIEQEYQDKKAANKIA